MYAKNQILEIYLFINPCEQESYQNEKNILTFAETRSEKTKIHFIPFLNFNTVSGYIAKQNLPEKDLTIRNGLYSKMYDTCLAFTAATMQGKKKGRHFLLALQKALFNEQKKISQELVLEKAREAKLDIPMFLEDLSSDYARTLFLSDQKVAAEMQVCNSSSCVIYSESLSDFGILIEESIPAEFLTSLFINKNGITAHLDSKAKPALRVLN